MQGWDSGAPDKELSKVKTGTIYVPNKGKLAEGKGVFFSKNPKMNIFSGIPCFIARCLSFFSLYPSTLQLTHWKE